MKKTILCGISIISLFTLTGCNNEKELIKGDSIELKKGSFTITCSGENNSFEGIEQQNEAIYNFNDEQYVINYEIITTQKFDKKDVYKTYKEAQEETVSSSSEYMLYNLKSNDKTKTLVLAMAIPNINASAAESEEQKAAFKASSILSGLRNSTEQNYTCEVEGIDESDLK